MKKSTKKKFIVSFILAGLAFISSGCDETNGWSAIPLDDTEDACYQITEWRSNGWGETKYWATGTYCPIDTEETK